jgi:hypothetical protein
MTTCERNDLGQGSEAAVVDRLACELQHSARRGRSERARYTSGLILGARRR